MWSRRRRSRIDALKLHRDDRLAARRSRVADAERCVIDRAESRADAVATAALRHVELVVRDPNPDPRRSFLAEHGATDADALPNDACEVAERVVACDRAALVVDVLEVVDVEDEQGTAADRSAARGCDQAIRRSDKARVFAVGLARRPLS